MIELEFFDSSNRYGVIKATVHKTGKLGFSSGASKFLDLDNIKYFNIGLNKKDEEDDNLYLVPSEKESEKSFKLVKAGDYYYLSIKDILRELKIDYKNDTVIYDIDELDLNDQKLYKLTRRGKK